MIQQIQQCLPQYRQEYALIKDLKQRLASAYSVCLWMNVTKLRG